MHIILRVELHSGYFNREVEAEILRISNIHEIVRFRFNQLVALIMMQVN